MTSPVNVNVDLKGVNKLFDMLKAYFGVRIARRRAEEDAAARVITAKADAEVKLITAKTDVEVKLLSSRSTIDEKKILLEGEHEIKALERKLTAEAVEVEALTEADFEVVWEEPNALALPQHRGPFQAVEEKRLNNIKQVTQEAMKALPEQREVLDEPVDPDWFARFFDNVKDVSQEDMQKLWGKLLAGEVARPESFSLRTLDILRNLTHAEAKIFARYCNICTVEDVGEIIVLDQKFADDYGIKQTEISSLIECNLFHQGRQFSLELKSPLVIPFGTQEIRVTATTSFNVLEGWTYPITRTGTELRSLLQYEIDDHFLQIFCAGLQRQALEGRIINVQAAEALVGDHPG